MFYTFRPKEKINLPRSGRYRIPLVHLRGSALPDEGETKPKDETRGNAGPDAHSVNSTRGVQGVPTVEGGGGIYTGLTYLAQGGAAIPLIHLQVRLSLAKGETKLR